MSNHVNISSYNNTVGPSARKLNERFVHSFLVKFFYFILPRKNLTWIHRSESELIKMHALLSWAIALSDVRTLFFANSLIALHSFSFAQKIKDHSSLLSVRSCYKSDVPSSGVCTVKCTEKRFIPFTPLLFFLNVSPKKNLKEALNISTGMYCNTHLLEIMRRSAFKSPLSYPSS